MYTGVFSLKDLIGIAAGIFFFIIIKYIFTKKKTTWRYKIGEYIILVREWKMTPSCILPAAWGWIHGSI